MQELMRKEVQTIQPMTFQEILSAADMVAKAQLFPGFDSAAKVATLMLLCQAEGCHPIQALTRYDIIQGRPAKKPLAMLEDFLACGGRVKWLRTDEKEARAILQPPNGEPLEVAFTMDQAERAGLTNKDSWKKYPEAMLRARLISAAMRMVWPRATNLLYIPEEVESFDSKVVQTVEPDIQDVEEVEDVLTEEHSSEPSEGMQEATQPAGDSPDALPMTPGLVRFVTRAQTLKAELGVEAYYTVLGSFGYEHSNQVPIRHRGEILKALSESRDDADVGSEKHHNAAVAQAAQQARQQNGRVSKPTPLRDLLPPTKS